MNFFVRFCVSLWLIFGVSFFISAQYFYTPHLLVPYTENVPGVVSRAAVLIDAQTGALLYSKNANEEIPPASLTKLMTMHLLMNEINVGRACYDELIPITVESWSQRQPPRSSLMFLEPGQRVTLREILLGLAVSSGNDASVAAALRLAPNMEIFAGMMTAEARRMGLNITRFAEASGYSSFNMTTAEEFAFFCYQYIRLYPDSMRYFHSVTEFSYPIETNLPEARRNNLHTITQHNRNRMLYTFSGVDGIKTGFIPESGYNIALTAERGNTRFILVVLGAPSQRGGDRIRIADSERILSWAFDNFKTVHINISQIDNEPLWKGKEKSVQLVICYEQSAKNNGQIVVFTSPENRADTLYYETVITRALIAPLPKDYHVGYFVISDEIGELHRLPLLTTKAYEKGNIFKRIWHSILLFFKNI
jgi:D-alanyl-D-alanine carboxypeptidase (penicillin-binding protein 5/6)